MLQELTAAWRLCLVQLGWGFDAHKPLSIPQEQRQLRSANKEHAQSDWPTLQGRCQRKRLVCALTHCRDANGRGPTRIWLP